MIRDDISNKLIHLIKGETFDDAAGIFLNIVEEEKLYGGSGFIKGGFNCICFSEAPISKLSQILATPSVHGVRYKPFGIMVDKDWLFERGGRPVIYQSDEEYNLLHEEQKYRHVRYEPLNNIDFTWEREWRIKVDELVLDPQYTTMVVPSRHWADTLIKRHMDFIQGAIIALGDTAALYAAAYKWHFIALEDLGVFIPEY